MKNISKTIASISLSFLAFGAFGQVVSNISLHQNAKHTAPAGMKFVTPAKHQNSGKKVGATTYDAFIDYVSGDQTIAQGGTFYYWNPPLYMNRKYVLGDTGTSPYTSGTANVNLCTGATVVYDTAWDLYNGGGAFDSPISNVVVDTVWAYMAFHNTSGLNDTLYISVCAVNASGYPDLSTVYTTQSVVMNTSTMTYNVLDSLQLIDVPLTTPVSVPSSARHGWNYCVNVTVGGSKSDTVGVWYWSQGSDCTGGFGVTSAYTTVGVPDGRATLVNSFSEGNAWFNDAANHGNGTQMEWPNSTSYPGYCINSGGYYFYDQLISGCTDSDYFPVQDLGLFVSMTYELATGVNNITANGLSVGQNYPNPFNQTTQITYSLTKSSDVTFSVYDMTGRVLINNVYSNNAPGEHVINLSANTLSPGIYFYSFDVNGSKVTKKMIVTE